MSEGRDETADWWASFEQASLGAGLPEDPEPWRRDLAALGLAELRMELTSLDSLLVRCQQTVLSPPWRRVLALLELRVEVRRGGGVGPSGSLARVRVGLDALRTELPTDERATRARAAHLRGVIALRHDALDEAEDALLEALASSTSEGCFRAWVLDTIGQVLIRLGAWQEARRTLEKVAQMKKALGDVLGTAITVGHLARMQLQLGEAPSAAAMMDDVLRAYGADLPSFTRLRLLTLLLEARIEARPGEPRSDELDRVAAQLASMMPTGEALHPLHGFAALALARAAALHAEADRVEAWLGRALEASHHPDARELCQYWRMRLLPATRTEDDLPHSTDVRRVPSEAEIGGLLLRAERAMGAGSIAQARDLLERAHDRAVTANNRLWVEWVYRTARMLDPTGAPERLARRFAGRSLAELETTTVADATIVFADLVGFTPRSLELAPEEVMATVRSLFELAVPALSRYRVRPLSCLGDALLAVAEGEGHEERGLSFAIDLVRRAARVTLVRHALGDRWGMDLRAGVASGSVVLGALGNHFKLEFAAIGLTTNLAARLQTSANAGEVVCSARTAARRAGLGVPERLKLKGFEGEIDALRIVVDAAGATPHQHQG